jgi:hypothetical protein
VSEARRLKAFEVANRRLKKLFAEGAARRRRAEGPAGKKLSLPPATLRPMAERGLSQRHVCRLLEVDPKTVRRPERRGDEAVGGRLRHPHRTSCWSAGRPRAARATSAINPKDSPHE